MSEKTVTMPRPNVELIRETLELSVKVGASDRVPERRVTLLLCEWIRILEEGAVCI